MDKATPRPWKVFPTEHRNVFWVGPDQFNADCVRKDNAALIVKAVNSYQTMVDALRSISTTSLADPASVEVAANYMVEIATEALKSAKGEA